MIKKLLQNWLVRDYLNNHFEEYMEKRAEKLANILVSGVNQKRKRGRPRKK